MTRVSIEERIRQPVYWVEQALHALLGGAIAYAFSDMGAIGAGVFSAVLGALREALQNLRFRGWRPYWDGSIADAGIDLAFWSLGAAIGSVIA